MAKPTPLLLPSFRILKLLFHCPLAYIVSNMKSAINLVFVSPDKLCLSALATLSVSPLSLAFEQFDYDVSWCVNFFQISYAWYSLSFLNL